MRNLGFNRFLLLVFVTRLFDLSQQKVLTSSDMEQQLIKHLFKGYVKDGRPVLNKSDSVEVKLDLAYSQLKELDGQNQVLQSKVWLRQYWTNSFLAWDPKAYGGVTTINVSPDLIWKPDIVLYNSVGYSETGSIYSFDTKAVLHNDGFSEWFAPTEIHSICEMDITNFPFDEQRCKLKFGSWSYTATALNLVNKTNSADTSKYIESGEWELKSASLVRNVVEYSCCPDPYVDITYTIHVKRKAKYYVSNLIIPCMMLATMMLFSHCLPITSGERMGIVITIVLGLTVFMLLLTENVPRTSEVTPLIGKYTIAIMCEVMLSLLMTCYIQWLFYKDPKQKLKGWLRWLVVEALAPLLQKTKPGEDTNNNAVGSRFDQKIGVKLAPCLKVVNSPDDAKLNRVTHPPKAVLDSTLVDSNAADTESFLSENLVFDLDTIDNLAKLEKGMQRIVKHIEDVKEDNERRNEWQLASEVIDSLFLWTLALTFAILSVAFYVKVA